MRTVALVVSAAAAAALLAGCGGSNTAAARDAMVRANPTPELDTLYQRPVDIDNRITLVEDENWRMFTEDLGRFWLFERPSRLTRERIPR
jgi:hypothetical protein